MNYSVILVQQGIFSPTHPVCGKSGKVYGHALSSPEHKGVAFAMGMKDYVEGMYDIVGNTTPTQQWVPEFVAAPVVESEGHGKCGIPGHCNLGPGGTRRDACYMWDRYLFCEFHAPSNATPLFVGAPPIQPPPSTQPEPEPEPVEEAPAPRFETEPPPAPAPAPAPSGGATVRETLAELVREELAAQMKEITATIKAALSNGHKPQKAKPLSESPKQAYLRELRAKAKELGINSFRMGVKQLEEAIAGATLQKTEPEIP